MSLLFVYCILAFETNLTFLKKKSGTGEVACWLRALAALAEDPSSISNADIRCLTDTYRDLKPLASAGTYTHTQMHITKNKVSL